MIKCIVAPCFVGNVVSNVIERVAFVLLLPFLSTRPIDWRFRILDLDGEAKMTLWRFLMLIPVLNVPYEATIIALFSCSVISLTFSRLLLLHHRGQRIHDDLPHYQYLLNRKVVARVLQLLKIG